MISDSDFWFLQLLTYLYTSINLPTYLTNYSSTFLDLPTSIYFPTAQ